MHMLQLLAFVSAATALPIATYDNENRVERREPGGAYYGSADQSQDQRYRQAYTNGQPGYTNGQPGYTNGQPGYANGQPGYANGQPGYANGQPGYANGQPVYTNGQPGYTNGQQGHITGQQRYQQPNNDPQRYQQPNNDPQRYQQPNNDPQRYQQFNNNPQRYQQFNNNPQRYQENRPQRDVQLAADPRGQADYYYNGAHHNVAPVLNDTDHAKYQGNLQKLRDNNCGDGCHNSIGSYQSKLNQIQNGPKYGYTDRHTKRANVNEDDKVIVTRSSNDVDASESADHHHE
ncbi:hypothetical protein P8C59_006156 [Phyllachora maydis]|uniref:Uncharacterized protein n=1 Tax=Phyllachora maydis TaxID=1825666 RepID=A0AAD9I6Z4_9PEZI|nr:hypothetical protein P8C59_006156 [Phyllachora maydis]